MEGGMGGEGMEMKQGCKEEGDWHHGWGHMDQKEMMMWILHMAKKELLKEKIKQRLQEAEGKKMDEIAKAVVEGKMEFMKMKKEMWAKKKQMMEKMMDIMGGEMEEEAED